MHTREKGKVAEQFAVEHLQAKDYQIISQNYQIWGGEIDIIALDKDELVFVEVKSLYDTKISIYETITKTKLKSLQKVINYWLIENNNLNRKWRLDFIGITLNFNNELIDIEHLPNVEI